MRKARELSLAERLEVEAALDAAFAPLRQATTGVPPTYARAAVRWGRAPLPQAIPWAGAVRRLSELSVAVGMSVVVFVAAFGGSSPVLEWPDADAMRQVQHAAMRQIEATRPEPRVEFAALRGWLDPTVVASRSTLLRTVLVAPQPHATNGATGPF